MGVYKKMLNTGRTKKETGFFSKLEVLSLLGQVVSDRFPEITRMGEAV